MTTLRNRLFLAGLAGVWVLVGAAGLTTAADKGSPAGHRYLKAGKIVWALTKADFERLGLKIMMICGIQRLPNGNTVLSNVSHGSITNKGKSYKILEISRDKKLVWKVDDPQFAKLNLGSIHIIDVKGDPAKFEVFK